MITLRLTPEELRTIQSALGFIQSLKGLLNVFAGKELSELDNKITAFIGDPLENLKRREAKNGIVQTYKGNPRKLELWLAELEKDYPKPPAFRH